MMYEIPDPSAIILSFDEERKILYTESSGIRVLRFPELEEAEEISEMTDAAVCFTEDGKRLCILDTGNRIEIHDIQDGKGTLVFKKEWADADGSGRNCCTDGRNFFVAIQNTVHCLDAYDPDNDRVIYGREYGEENRENWQETGLIRSISYYNGEIILIHAMFHHNYLVRIDTADYSVTDRLEVPSDIGMSLLYATHDNKGGLCLSGIIGNPLLHYKTFPKDILDPNEAIRLSGKVMAYLSPRFSANGEYMTFQAITGGPNYSEAWLIRTEDWSLVKTITDRRILYAPFFSSKGRYWLIPGKNPLIIDLESEVQ